MKALLFLIYVSLASNESCAVVKGNLRAKKLIVKGIRVRQTANDTSQRKQ